VADLRHTNQYQNDHLKFAPTVTLVQCRISTKLEVSIAILQYFEYFYQMSSKSILIILSYTVSKLVRFSRQCINFLYIYAIAYLHTKLESILKVHLQCIP